MIREKREARHEERRAAGACFNCGDIGHLSRDCPNNPRAGVGRGGGVGGNQAAAPGGGSQGRGRKDRPPRGRDKAPADAQQEEEDSGDADEPGFQEPHDVACIHGGAYALTSHNAVKKFTREVCALQLSVEAQQPLKWSHVPITFNLDDHHDRNLGSGVLPHVVSPVISNMTVTKMLVDNGASLNLLSTTLVEKLQLPLEEMKPTVPFRGIDLGVVQPMGQITLPVTFGSGKHSGPSTLFSM